MCSHNSPLYLPFSCLKDTDLQNWSFILDVSTASVGRKRLSEDKSQLAETDTSCEEDSKVKWNSNCVLLICLFIFFCWLLENYWLNCFRSHSVVTLSFSFMLQSHDKKIGAANDYHTSNLQLAKERSWLITPYNVHPLVLQALRYIMLHWEGDSVS